MADPLDPALPSSSAAEFAAIEAEWREALTNGRVVTGRYGVTVTGYWTAPHR
jgi:hypothetical protein